MIRGSGSLLIFNLKTDSDDDVLGFTTDWINELAERFARVYVITMNQGVLRLKSNVEVRSVGKEKGYSEFRRAVDFYRHLVYFLAKRDVTACFAHMMPLFAVMGWPLLRVTNKPVVLWYAHKSTTPILRIATMLVDRVVTSSRSGFRVVTPKLKIIGQGIDTLRFSRKHYSEKWGRQLNLLTVGRISPIKNVGACIRALQVIQERLGKVEVHLTIVGGPLVPDDVNYVEQLKALAASLGVSEKTHFTGPLPFREVHQCYMDAHIFISASETGSVDKTLLEAMSCGIPIVTCNESMREILTISQSQKHLVGRNDSSEMAASIVRIANLPANEFEVLCTEMRRTVEVGHSLNLLADKLTQEIINLKVAHEQV